MRDELDRLQQELVDGQELEKVKNKFESTQIFGNINYLNVATNLAWFELLGKAEDLEKAIALSLLCSCGKSLNRLFGKRTELYSIIKVNEKYI